MALDTAIIFAIHGPCANKLDFGHSYAPPTRPPDTEKVRKVVWEVAMGHGQTDHLGERGQVMDLGHGY